MRRRRIKRSCITKVKLCLIFVVTALCIRLAFTAASDRILPVATALAAVEAKNSINRVIYDTINKTVVEGDIVTADFYNKTEDADGSVTSLTVNTVLVNTLCAEVAQNISDVFTAAGSKVISIPVGSLTGIDIFANMGPGYPIRILPGGNAEVDYETKFEAVGINQINFQVWLKVSVAMRIVNPIQTDRVVVERKVAVVNTVFSGKVPESFIGGIPFNVGK